MRERIIRLGLIGVGMALLAGGEWARYLGGALFILAAILPHTQTTTISKSHRAVMLCRECGRAVGDRHAAMECWSLSHKVFERSK